MPARSTRVLAPVLIALVAALLVPSGPSADAGARSPLSRPLDVAPLPDSVRPALADPRFSDVLSRPVALWLTEVQTVHAPEPWHDVRTVTAQRLREAAANRATPVLVLYALPARDCGYYSAGGLPDDAAYRAWVDEIAAAVAGVPAARPMVIVEPDALAMLGSCAGQGDRVGLIRYAARRLTRAGAYVYLDAGHAGWISPRRMAARLKAAGVGRTRGFATNVAAFGATSAQRRYAAAINRSLVRRGVGGRHYVVDVSRNGAAVAPGVWCNPAAARLGSTPRIVARGRVDALLWVKTPWASDGECGRGEPAAGVAWPEGTLRLLGR